MSAVGHQSAQRFLIRWLDDFLMTKVTLSLGRFLGQDVIEVRLRTLELAARGAFEALCGASIGLHLRHFLQSP